MKKVLITGCFGRIGYRLAQRLHGSYDLIGIDNDHPQEKELPFDYYYADLSSDSSVKDAFDAIYNQHGREIECVIHLAAYYSFKGGGYDLYQKVTVDGTKRLISNLLEARVQQFIFSSTLLVYAPCSLNEKIREDSPLQPKWEYPKSKVEAEEIILAHKEDFPVVIFRIAGCYDEGCHSIPIAHQIDRIYQKSFKSHFYPGKFESGSPYLHFDDLVDAFCLVIERRESLSHEEIFLLGEEETLSHEELQTLLGKLIWNRPWKTFRIPKWLAKCGAFLQEHLPFMPEPFIRPWMIDLTDDYYSLDISKAKEVLDWQPRYTIKDVLPFIVRDLKENPSKWYQSNKIKG